MKELIERLRCFDRVTCNEAADLLEQQAAEIETEIELRHKAEQGLVDWRVKYTELQDKLDTAIQSSAHWQHQCTELQAKLSAMEAVEPVSYTVSGEIRNWAMDFSKYKTQHYTRPLYTAPKVGFHEYELEMPQGDNRKARIRWTESVMGASTTKHHLCISVDGAPKVAQPLTKETIREAGGIVHGDGNIFFTNLDQLNAAIGGQSAPKVIPLTDEQIWELAANCLDGHFGRLNFARAIEAAHGITKGTPT